MRSLFRIVAPAFALAAVAVPGLAFAAGAGGVTGPGFYVDGVAYRTVGTPTDLSNTGGPDHSFDTIYDFGGAQDLNVATAAPGDQDFNGGRWRVYPVTFTDYDAALAAHDANNSGDFDSDAEIDAAVMAGDATIGSVAKSFECPVIPLPRN